MWLTQAQDMSRHEEVTTMKIQHGLTTWIVSLGPVAVIWRWNMGCAEAVLTAAVQRHPACCYAMAGPLIIEWRRHRAVARH